MPTRIWFRFDTFGPAVTRVQRALNIDAHGTLDTATQDAIRDYQRGLTTTGDIDGETYTALTQQDAPPLLDRVLGLTAHLNGRRWDTVSGNCNGKGVEWGLLGFDLASGGLCEVLRDMPREPLDMIFMPGGTDLVRGLRAMTAEKRLEWAEGIQQGHEGIRDPWLTRFRKLGRTPEAQAAQVEVARIWHYQQARFTFREAGLRSERGMAFVFDCCVQNGAVHPGVMAAMKTERPQGEEAMLVAAAHAVVDTVPPYRKVDELARKMLIARGQGTWNERNYDLDDWGLTLASAGDGT